MKFLTVPVAMTPRGWRAWEAEQRAARPFLFFLGWALPVWWAGLKGRIRDGWWSVVHRVVPRYRYHKLDLRRGDPTGEYRSGWRDTDTQLELACCALVRNYVERELPHAWHKETDDDTRARKLHEFWMVRLPALRKEQDELLDVAFGGSHKTGDELNEKQLAAFKRECILDVQIDDEIAAAMNELVAIRKGLWS